MIRESFLGVTLSLRLERVSQAKSEESFQAEGEEDTSVPNLNRS